MSKTPDNKCITCGIIFTKECNYCKKFNSINDCFEFIETFIETKRNLEFIDPIFEKPTLEERRNNEKRGIRYGGMWDINADELLNNEIERAKLQKEKNDEYLPLFHVFYKALELIVQRL